MGGRGNDHSLSLIDQFICKAVDQAGFAAAANYSDHRVFFIINLQQFQKIDLVLHMAGESELPFARGGDAVRVKELLDKERYVIAAEYEEDTGKYASLTDEKLEELRELCDVMLVEADGAKHHPVKVPEKWEPVIPRCADIVISVIGLDCLGQPISQSAYRMERTSEFLRKSLEAPITEEDIVKIATSICGLFKDVEERVYRVYLNKSDILKEKEPAEHIVEELERKNTVAAYGSLLEE